MYSSRTLIDLNVVRFTFETSNEMAFAIAAALFCLFKNEKRHSPRKCSSSVDLQGKEQTEKIEIYKMTFCYAASLHHVYIRHTTLVFSQSRQVNYYYFITISNRRSRRVN